MTEILLSTHIHASIETCFDLARDIDIHTKSTAKTKERAIAGRTSGLCELHDEITWEAIHFGIKQHLTVQITRMERPRLFADRMLKGAFKSMSHEHHFEGDQSQCTMNDVFRYEVPFGFIGRLFDKLILKNYMTRFLKKRNAVLKEIAERQDTSSSI